MQLADLWRYPVKSLAGERLAASDLGDRGLPGDRGVAAFETSPHPKAKELSARDVSPLLQFRSRLNGSGPEISGPELAWTPWAEAQVGAALSRRCRRTVELRAVPEGAFDSFPILMVHLDTIRALGAELGREVDRRRFRANLYLDEGGIAPHGEPELAGRQIRVGEAVLEVARGCPRCAITTRDPDTWASWPQLLRHLVQAHRELVGVYCLVAQPGRVAVGDGAELL